MNPEIKPLNCIICDKPLESVAETVNQPHDAVVFRAYGQYGSTVFDPFDGSFLEVSICDSCISAKHESVWHYPAPRRRLTMGLVQTEQDPPQDWNPGASLTDY